MRFIILLAALGLMVVSCAGPSDLGEEASPEETSSDKAVDDKPAKDEEKE